MGSSFRFGKALVAATFTVVFAVLGVFGVQVSASTVTGYQHSLVGGQPVAVQPKTTPVANSVTSTVRTVSDFTQPYMSLERHVGRIPAVAICFDPGRPGHAAPTANYLRGLHDGSDGGRNVQAWYRENTGSLFGFDTPTFVGCNDGNWLTPPPGRTGNWYWDTNNFALMFQDALTAAAPFVDFKGFDGNHDNVLNGDEVVVEIIRPQNDGYGTNRTVSAPLGGCTPFPAPVCGVSMTVTVLDLYLSSYTDNAHRLVNVGLLAHESAHNILGAVDMYGSGVTGPSYYSIMDSHWNANHFDPFHKLKSGFVTPSVVELFHGIHTTATLPAVETQQHVTIVYDPTRSNGEYFILENRWGGNGNFDQNLPAQGIAVWHIVEDTATQNQFPPAGSLPSTGWDRRAVRLLGVLSGAGQSMFLRYADGSSVGTQVVANANPQEFLDALIVTGVQIGLLPNYDTKLGVAQSVQLTASDGVLPYTWTVAGLPTGLSYTPAGLISGTPTAVGAFSGSYTLTDGTGTQTTRFFTWTVSSTENRTFIGTATSTKPTTAESLALSRAQAKATGAGFPLSGCAELDQTIEFNDFGSWVATVTLACSR